MNYRDDMIVLEFEKNYCPFAVIETGTSMQVGSLLKIMMTPQEFQELSDLVQHVRQATTIRQAAMISEKPWEMS
jgi:TusA-related sulfurtransferase